MAVYTTKKHHFFILILATATVVPLCGSFFKTLSPVMQRNTKIAGALIGAAALIKCIHYWSIPDRSFPTIDKLHVLTFLPITSARGKPIAVEKWEIKAVIKKQSGIIQIHDQLYCIHVGIPNEIHHYTQPIYIYSPGIPEMPGPLYSAVHPAFCVYTAIKAGNIQGPCVVFDYPTRARRSFNFCQAQDLHCLDLVYTKLITTHPTAQVVLFGNCIGATTILRMLTEKAHDPKYLSAVKAVIAETPVISLKHIFQYALWGGRLTHLLCRLNFPNYTPKKLATIMDEKPFPSTIPVLIGSLPYDTVSALPDIKKMVTHLRSQSNGGQQIEHFICDGPDKRLWHCQMGKSKGWQAAIKLFVQRLTPQNS